MQKEKKEAAKTYKNPCCTEFNITGFEMDDAEEIMADCHHANM
jgi:hypothetical protein